MTYAEYLKSQGATEDDVKVLDTAIGRKAFDKLQSDATAAAADAAAAKQATADFKAETDKWYNETILPNYTTMEQKAATAAANEARAIALVRASQDEGLKKVAESMGYKTDGAPAAPAAPAAAALPSGFDPAKFVTQDSLAGIMDRAGEGLAALEDMVIEHHSLFPTERLNVRELRREAVAAKKTAYEYWEQKYKVPEVRATRAAADKSAHETKLREEGAAAEREKLATQYGNPDLRPPVPSRNPFAAPPGRDATKQPWEDGDRSAARVQRATKAVLDQQAKAN